MALALAALQPEVLNEKLARPMPASCRKSRLRKRERGGLGGGRVIPNWFTVTVVPERR